ncbi:MAG: hypothetical protein N2578_03055 [Bdellovibrionaceae bacterium]|nr:hypothetical protein [Pseudobdellovibrionaceae bacterium]
MCIGRFLPLFMFASVQVLAQSSGVSFRIHEPQISARAAGMGNAFTAVANDYSAIFYNPAALARREDGELNLFIDAGVNTSIFRFADDITKAQNTPGTDAQKQQAVIAAIEKYYGRGFGFRVQPAAGYLVRPGWGIAFIPVELTVEEVIHKGVGPSVDTTVYADTTLAGSYADDFKGLSHGRLSWGVTGKFVNRGYFSKSINFVEIATNPNLVGAADLTEGYTVDADVGLLYTPVIPDSGFISIFRLARPSFALVARNVLDLGFNHKMGLINKNPTDGKPEKLIRRIDIGTRWEYPSFWIFGGRGVMDFRNLLHPNWTFKKGLHIGFEFDWTMASWWRGAYRVGLSHGYLTAGVSAMLATFNLDLVTYAEDGGPPTNPVENRYVLMRLNFNI